MNYLPSIFCLSLLTLTAHADVKLHGLFADHMVLQRDQSVPVWGTADAGEAVTLSFAGQTKTATANAKGQWLIKLDPMPASAEPRTLGISSNNPKSKVQNPILSDVLVGDVWLCSGQSNMASQVNSVENAEVEMAAANHPLIRHIRVKLKSSETPLTNIQGQWTVCSPDTVKDYSAVSYFFARDISTDLQVPIGLINSTWGGTSATAWMSTEALATDPMIAVQWAKQVKEFPAAKVKYEAALAVWEKGAAEAKATGQTYTQKKPLFPTGPGDRNSPAALWNGMIAPLMPAPFKGILWYQGEQDASKHASYHLWFPTLIKQWRRDFGQGDLPFLYVQLPNHNSEGAYSLSWAFMRGVQTEALNLPNTGMAVTIDVGENENVHPKKKQPVGHRLALIAKAKVYGQQVPYEGPIYGTASAEGNAMIVHFQRSAEGLKMKGDALREFQLAGADKQFKPATAVIEGQSIRVTSPEVPAPIAVRYAWRNGSEANLYNQSDLPASPFRSDDWTPQGSH